MQDTWQIFSRLRMHIWQEVSMWHIITKQPANNYIDRSSMRAAATMTVEYHKYCWTVETHCRCDGYKVSGVITFAAAIQLLNEVTQLVRHWRSDKSARPAENTAEFCSLLPNDIYWMTDNNRMTTYSFSGQYIQIRCRNDNHKVDLYCHIVVPPLQVMFCTAYARCVRCEQRRLTSAV